PIFEVTQTTDVQVEERFFLRHGGSPWQSCGDASTLAGDVTPHRLRNYRQASPPLPMAVRAGMPERTGVTNAVKPRRSLEDPGCLGMLLIAISGAWRQDGVNRRVQPGSMGSWPTPDFQPVTKRAPERGSVYHSDIVKRQSLQHRRVGIEDQHAHIGKRREMEDLQQGLQHAALPALLEHLRGADAFDS